MSKLLVFDGNFFLHKAFAIAGKHRKPEHLEKSTLSGFLQSICGMAVERRATHVLVTFDASRSFRHEIYSKYKANRVKEKLTTVTQADGTEYKTELSPGRLVKTAKIIMQLSGITYAQKKGYEGDDIFGCVVNSLADGHLFIECQTRDKDMLGLISDKNRVIVYWPKEKRVVNEKALWSDLGIKPFQVRDYLALIGDKVDNIPGIEGWGPVTAKKFLNKYGSIKKALDNKEGRSILLPHSKTIQLSRALVTLKKDVPFVLEDMVVQNFENDLLDYVWKIPDSLKDLADVRKANSIRGLFGRR